MTVTEIANGLVAHCQRGDFAGAMQAYYHPDIESVEGDGVSMGPSSRVRGIAACAAKGEYWQSAHEIHSMNVTGPFIGDGQFAALFDMDITIKATGQRVTGREVAVYRVADGKIVSENFMMQAMG
jgi:ketosteroid isomerase-like protein